jgi:dihydroxy-acid dehydratase
MVGHVAPEAARGGPLAVVRDGDGITIDLDARSLTVELTDAEIAARLADWTPPAPSYDFGVFARYRACVSSASEGAVLGPGGPVSYGPAPTTNSTAGEER